MSRGGIENTHLELLKKGVQMWNQHRREHPDIKPYLAYADLSKTSLTDANLYEANLYGANLSKADLSGADLREADLREADLKEARLTGAKISSRSGDEFSLILPSSRLIGNAFRVVGLRRANLNGADLRETNLREVDLREANLSGADISFANLYGAELSGADLSGAVLHGANLWRADLSRADLSRADLARAVLIDANLSYSTLGGANLYFADLRAANLSGADLRDADLTGAVLLETNLRKAILTNCRVYGTSVWDVDLTEANQSNLIITPSYLKGPRKADITVDNLKVAQFIYLLLHNEEIRDVINTIGQKGVLILGRFSQERKLVLDALREKLRTLNFLPIVFDFEHPVERDFTETILTLTGLSCFVIADITNPKSSPLELQATVPNYMIPFVPIIQQGEKPFAMFQDLRGKYDWVLDTLEYDTPSRLIQGLEEAIVRPALEKRAELMPKKVEQLQTRHISDYL